MKLKKILMTLLLTLGVGVGAFAGINLANKEVTPTSATGKYDNTIRLYFDIGWENITNVRVNELKFIDPNSDSEEYDTQFGNFVLDINSTANWEHIPLSFTQDGATFKPNTLNANNDRVLGTNQENMGASVFELGKVYFIHDIGYVAEGSTATLKYFSYKITSYDLLEEKINYNFVVELNDDCASYEYSAQKNRLYLSPGVWNVDGAYFEAWIWGNSIDDQWVKFNNTTTVGGKSYYYADLPGTTKYTDVTGLKILRKSPFHASEQWQSWNDTGNVALNSGNNLVTITGWGSRTTGKVVEKVNYTGLAQDFTNYIHIFDSSTDFILNTWKSDEAKLNKCEYIYSDGNLSSCVYYSFEARVIFDKFIIVSDFTKYEEITKESSHLSISNLGENIYGATVKSNIYDTTSASIDENSNDKTLAFAFLAKFNELTNSRINNDICDAVDADRTLFDETLAIYNSFNHAFYVDSLKDEGNVTENEKTTIGHTMSYLESKYSKKTAQKSNLLILNRNNENNDYAFVIVIVIASLLGVSALAYFLKKKYSK